MQHKNVSISKLSLYHTVRARLYPVFTPFVSSLSHSFCLPLSPSFPLALLSHSKLIPTCPRTITKPACLFMLHRGITLFLFYYFFVKSPRYDLPQTALHCPTLIIFSHFATLRHRGAHTCTMPHKPTAVCASFLCSSMGSMEKCTSLYFSSL